MSIRHLDSLFQPQSVAVFGASDRPGSVGTTVWRNLVAGGFKGALYPVNLRRAQVGGVPAFDSVAALPETPELAVICTPPATVAGLLQALGARGTRAAIVLTAGFTPAQKQALLDAARQHLLRILGPNCLGLLSPHAGLNASFAHVAAAPGPLAFVSQSGALVTAMLDWARGRGIGFSQFVSLGEHVDVDFGDLLDWLANDRATRAILLYIESVEAPRKFMSAARAAARNKPVIVVKAGRSQAGQQAAASHTGALAGSDVVFDAAIRRAGMLRVDTLQQLFMAAETLAHFHSQPAAEDGQPAASDRLTLVTNGGGAGVMAADAAASAGVALAELPKSLLKKLGAGLPPTWSKGNPVDIIGDAPVERYVHTLRTLLAAPEAGTLLFMHAPTAIVPSAQIAQALLPVLTQAGRQPPPLLGCWLGDAAVREAREQFQAAGVPCYDTPEQAVQAFAMLLEYRRNQAQLMETPALAPLPGPGAGAVASTDHGAADFDLAGVRQAMAPALDRAGQGGKDGREWLTEPEAKALLSACGIATVATDVAGPSPQEAAAAAQVVAAQAGWPVVLKILSPDITHKSDVGGVALALGSAEAVQAAAAQMLKQVRAARPKAHITGFTVQQMVQRPRAQELIVGTHLDPLFGPVILFGQGGTAVEVLADRAVALPPLNLPLARALVQRTRVARLLAGWRDVPAADADALHGVLCRVSQLLAAVPEITTLDINPLLADADGVLALDARVGVDVRAPGGAQAFAIRPYPSQLVRSLDWQGQVLTLRPIRPEDEAQHRRFLERLDPEDIRMRVFYSRQTIARSELARLTQIDYEREMAFIATAPDTDGQAQTLGVARAVADPDNQGAEFGIVVRSDLKGGGLGRLLMDTLIEYQRGRGTQTMHGSVLTENARMLELAHDLGFRVDPDAGTSDTVRVHLPLQPGAPVPVPHQERI